MAALRAELDARFDAYGVQGKRRFEITLDMRLVGQAFEIAVPLEPAALTTLDEAALLAGFSAAHERIYRAPADTARRAVEIISYRAGLHVTRAGLPGLGGVRRLDGPCAGPLLIEDSTASIWVPPGWMAEEDAGIMITISPADQAVIGQALMSAAREMGAKLYRSAFSPIVRDGKDASTGIMDASGAAVAQSDELIPVLVGSLSITLRHCMAACPPERLEEGDFYITNHPYRGAHHLQDILIFMPAFVEGRIVAYAAAVAHHLDVGGGAPGLN
eukprot:gene51854-63407_t